MWTQEAEKKPTWWNGSRSSLRHYNHFIKSVETNSRTNMDYRASWFKIEKNPPFPAPPCVNEQRFLISLIEEKSFNPL